ncbi:prohibitin family protein [Candidatus Falkowbacteria bacterium]|jgi:regulator of protease activity HflC (stomatin/prohibitin superfamily)|nr:prohibitin family protein [Candidatus Falkowbacteria bacterium]MBT4433568.1 prohibitin family protein [Candidatus Falkowbacteria bacterium]
MSENLDKMMYSFVMEDVLKGFFIKVPPGYVACVYDLGRGVLKKVLRPGLHLKVPFWQKAKLFNTQTLEYNISKNFDINKIKVMGDEPVRVVSGDGKVSLIEGTILLRLDVDQIPHMWQNIGEEFVEKIIRPTVRSRTRLIASKYTFNEIVSLKRDEVEIQLKEELERIFYPRGILVENILLSEIRPTK